MSGASAGATAVPRGRRIASLDGIRAFAVGIVILYHWDIAGFTGGHFGVDVFFALSGFLITSLLLDELRGNGSIDVRRFWTRRITRLWPESLALLAVTLVVAPLFAQIDYRHTVTEVATAVLQVNNWMHVLSKAVPTRMISHLWSLSIEEQFYMVWPAMLFGIHRLARRSSAGVAALTGAVLAVAVVNSFVLRAHHVRYERIYFATDVRAVQLLIGCATAAVLDLVRVRRASAASPGATGSANPTIGVLANAVAVVGALGLLWLARRPLAGPTEPVRSLLLSVAPSVLTVAMVVAFVEAPTAILTRLTGARPFAWFGRISYSVYLWHMPIGWFFLESGKGSWISSWALARALAFAITMVVAVGSDQFGRRVGRVLAQRLRGAAPATATA